MLHIIGAGVVVLCHNTIQQQPDFSSFYPGILAYMIVYICPTLALVNSVAFKQMTDPSKDFPLIRIFGTGGWMIAGVMLIGVVELGA